MPKAAAYIPAAADKVVRFVQDTANEKEDEKKDQVSPSTTIQEDDEDSKGSFTTITDIVESHQEDAEDNQKTINDDQDIVVEDAQIMVEKAFLMEAVQPTIEDDQNIIGEDVETKKEKADKGPKNIDKDK